MTADKSGSHVKTTHATTYLTGLTHHDNVLKRGECLWVGLNGELALCHGHLPVAHLSLGLEHNGVVRLTPLTWPHQEGARSTAGGSVYNSDK